MHSNHVNLDGEENIDGLLTLSTELPAPNLSK